MQATPMSAGETRTVTIYARPRNNATGVLLEPGVTYQFRAEGKWRDASIECGPDGHDAAKLRAFRWMRRSRPHDWFALMGRAGGETFLIGSAASFTPSEGGELVCYANDVWFTYGNNDGSVTLTISR